MARTEGEGAERLQEELDEQKGDTGSRDKVPEKPPHFYTLLDMVLGRKYDLVPSRLPSALATAHTIEDISGIIYPEGIKSPKAELNMNAKQGKFRYDRDFLLQFMAICKETPDSLPPLDALIWMLTLETRKGRLVTMPPDGSRQPTVLNVSPPSSTARQDGAGLSISGIGAQSGFTVGQSATPSNKMSSEERFAMSDRSASMPGGPAGLPFGRPSLMVRSSDRGGSRGAPVVGNSSRAGRGEKRNLNNAAPSQPSAFGETTAVQPANLELVIPLYVSATRWTPASRSRRLQVYKGSPEFVERKVTALLNKLTMVKFDSISDQIIAWANKSEKENDGRTLIQVIKLVFERATDEVASSEMYARLCRKMMEQISPKVQDDGIRSSDGRHVTGGHLFRKYLLNRCQEDFERGWAYKESTATVAVSKAGEDGAVKAAAGSGDGESALYSNEHYAAQKARRQGLGLIKFIGELFKLQMFTERIMHECVKKLLSNVENPEEEEIKSLCMLLVTVGALLDTPKARAHMDVYFSRMNELSKGPNVTPRMQCMLQDIIELRERKWAPRNRAVVSPTLAAASEQAAKKANAEREQYHRRGTSSMLRGSSSRAGPTRGAPPKAGDLSNFGKTSKPATMTFGPSSVFAGKKDSKRDSPTIARQGSANMFSVLGYSEPVAADAPLASSSSQPSTHHVSVDLGSGSVPDAAPQRRKLNLLPRSTPKHAQVLMSDEEVKACVEEDTKEFFSVRDLEKAEVYFTKLPVEHRHKLVDKLITFALESKEADATLVADLFSRAAAKNLASLATFEQGFEGTAESLDDIAVDAPKAPQYFIKMMQGAGLDKDEERRTRLLSRSAQ